MVNLNKVTMNKYTNMTNQPIYMLHHTDDAMNDSKFLSKTFLGPTSKLVNISAIL